MSTICFSSGIGRKGLAALLLLSAAGLTQAQEQPLTTTSPSAVKMEHRLGDEPVSESRPASSPATSASTGQPSEAEMMQMMMEMSKLNENHKLLAGMDGTWNYTVKMWMNGDPTSKAEESKGTATRKSIMGGRYFEMESKGKMEMPGPDGKMKAFDFVGRSVDGYDNAKKKFVGTWIDNMGTGIMNYIGDYEPATKTFTYSAEFEVAPGVVQKVRETLQLTDKDHMVMDWFENRGGHEVKTMEIDYTRAK